MLTKLKKTENEGFTIIEVMIVLAIAGLILLIVLLAVPALQRSARNTAIKNDASALAAGVSEYESNNSGALPTNTGTAVSGPTITFTGGSGTDTAVAKIQGSTKVTYLTASPTASPAVSNIDVVFGQECSSTTGYTTTANSRSTAIVYGVETGSSGTQAQCLSS